MHIQPLPTALIGQCLLGTGALALIAFAPPAKGRMTIVSLTGQSGGEIAGWATGGDVRIVAAEGHSLTLEGSRGALIGTALSHGALLVAARPGLCGDGASA